MTIHAAERALERHGIVLTPEMLAAVLMDITDTVLGLRSAALMLRRYPPSALHHLMREVWMVHLGTCDAQVVWCPATATVVTVLGR